MAACGKYPSHYEYLREHLPAFFNAVSVRGGFDANAGIIIAHGDKTYGYKSLFEKAGIHFYHGTAIYMLTKVAPYGQECRQTEDGWIDPGQWVVDNAHRFINHLPPVEP